MKYEPELCEWNPKHSRPSYCGGDDGACSSVAVVSVGTTRDPGRFHLCGECAKLSDFDRFQNRKVLATFGRARI